MRLRTANNRHKAVIRRQLGHEVMRPGEYKELLRAWKRFEHNSEGLRLGAYCFGCRGHPGIVTNIEWDRRSPWGSDFSVTSLIDGVEENCSVFHCGFAEENPETAIAYAEYAKRHGEKMATLKFFPHAYKAWEDQWNDPEIDYDWKRESKSLQEYMSLNDVEFKAFLTGEFPE